MSAHKESVVTKDEMREAFEAWMATSNYPEIADVALRKLPDGEYHSQLTHAAWQAWQGAIRAHPMPDAISSRAGGGVQHPQAASATRFSADEPPLVRASSEQK